MAKQPPFSAAIEIDNGVITESDPTTLFRIQHIGRGDREMYDRRFNAAFHFDAYLFDVSFKDCLAAEFQVNPEFGSAEAAFDEVQKYAPVIGRLPTVLRSRLKTVWIHKGRMDFGGGNENLLIHTDRTELYESKGILEETLVHETAHTSLQEHNTAQGWLAAQEADGTFISTYARDYAEREDIAESFVCYLAVRYRSRGVISPQAAEIMRTIPNRIAYFDKQGFAMHPLTRMSDAAVQRMLELAALAEQNPFYTGATRSPLENE